MDYLRRGKATQAIFDRATTATRIFYSYSPRGTYLSSMERITVAEAQASFDAQRGNRRVRMGLRPDGIYVFVIGTQVGYERIEIEV